MQFDILFKIFHQVKFEFIIFALCELLKCKMIATAFLFF